MAIVSLYITDPQFESILRDLNIDGKTAAEKQELLDRAVGDMEADLVERFIVPLEATGGSPYATAPQYARNKVLNTVRAKIRQLVGVDHNRNLIVDSSQRFIDVHGKEYKDSIAVLLDPKKKFGLRLQSFAEGALEPTQGIGLSRADHAISYEDDPYVP